MANHSQPRSTKLDHGRLAFNTFLDKGFSRNFQEALDGRGFIRAGGLLEHLLHGICMCVHVYIYINAYEVYYQLKVKRF